MPPVAKRTPQSSAAPQQQQQAAPQQQMSPQPLFLMMPQQQMHFMHHKHSHKIVIFIVALGALILLLRTQAKNLQNDWTPVGIGVKFLLVACVVGLIYYPYELFVKGPDAVDRAMRTPT